MIQIMEDAELRYMQNNYGSQSINKISYSDIMMNNDEQVSIYNRTGQVSGRMGGSYPMNYQTGGSYFSYFWASGWAWTQK